MKYKIFIAAMALVGGLASCSNDFELPPMIVPEATMSANTSILELKQLYWQNDRNYCSDIHELNSDEDLIIRGRVVSSDATGNIYKNIVVEDSTAAITIAINAYDLYESYQYGQEIVVNCTGLQIGGYNGLMQMGSESSYNGSPSMTFMSKELFADHAEAAGLSNPNAVVPTLATIPDLMDYKKDQANLMKWQSRLVKIDSVAFQDAGKKFAPTATTDRYVKDKEGNRINVRCSTYATFKDDVIPSGYGCVVGILSYYGSDWQLMLNDLDGLTCFTPYVPGENESEPKGEGTIESPYNVAKALEIINAGTYTSDKVYIEGTISKVDNVDTSYGNATYYITDGDDEELEIYRGYYLNGAKFTSADQIKKDDKVVVYGELTLYNGKTPEVTSGSSIYSLNGVTSGGNDTPETPVTPDTPNEGTGDGTEASPYDVAQVIAMNPQGKQDSPDKTDVWVAGYIVGWADMSSTYYINAETAKFSAPATMATNILLAASPDVKDYSQCIGVQLPSGAVRTALNLVDNPKNLGRGVKLFGNISKYSGVPGFTKSTKYAWLDDSSETPDASNTTAKAN